MVLVGMLKFLVDHVSEMFASSATFLVCLYGTAFLHTVHE